MHEPATMLEMILIGGAIAAYIGILLLYVIYVSPLEEDDAKGKKKPLAAIGRSRENFYKVDIQAST